MTGDPIVALGIDSDRTFVNFLARSKRFGLPVAAVNLRQVVAGGGWRLAVPDDGGSFLETPSLRLAMSPGAAVYCRLINLEAAQEDPAQARRWRGLVDGLHAWLAATPGIVVNRPGSHSHNSSKSYHEWWLAGRGLRVAPSLTSCDSDALRSFASEGRTIVKTCSGVRANASELCPSDLDRFDARQGPLHLQRLVPGHDVRAHVVGDEVVAVMIRAEGVDYRRRGSRARYEPVELPEPLQAAITAATAAMGLLFAGWDFKVDGAGVYWCLEANPMPGYESYDRRLDGAITAALHRVLRPEGAAAATPA